jgi:transcriptional regulator with XRE-family HTH domain
MLDSLCMVIYFEEMKPTDETGIKVATKVITFADILKRIGEDAGMSQYALAKQSGISKQALSQLELGTSKPTWDTVQALAAALGVDCTAFQSSRSEKEPKKRGKK